MKTRLLGIGMLAAALSGIHASPADAIKRVPTTLIGERVRVTSDTGDQRILGTVTETGPSTIQLADSLSSAWTFAYDEIDVLERSLGMMNNSAKGFLWGAGVGFGLGLVAGGVLMNGICSSQDCPNMVSSVIVGGPVGALPVGLLGALLGAASSSERWEIVPIASAQDFGFRVRLPAR